MQAGHQELNAPSPDDPGSLYNGLFSPNTNNRVAGYVFNELQFTSTTKAQIAGRIEHVELHGSNLDFPADFLPDGNPQFSTPRNPSFTPKSGSVGLLHMSNARRSRPSFFRAARMTQRRHSISATRT